VSKLQSHRWTAFGDLRFWTNEHLHFYLYRFALWRSCPQCSSGLQTHSHCDWQQMACTARSRASVSPFLNFLVLLVPSDFWVQMFPATPCSLTFCFQILMLYEQAKLHTRIKELAKLSDVCRFVTMVYQYDCHNPRHYTLSCLLFKTQLNSIGLSVPHRKHITCPLRAQQVNAIYRFVTMVH
jgi:hypothetical protein